MEINSDSGHSQKMPLDTVKFRQVPKVKDQYLRLRITSLRTKPLGQDSLHTEMQTMGGVFFLLKFDYKHTHRDAAIQPMANPTEAPTAQRSLREFVPVILGAFTVITELFCGFFFFYQKREKKGEQNTQKYLIHSW